MPRPWRTTGRNVHQKSYETAENISSPSSPVSTLLLLLRSPRQPHQPLLNDRELHLFHAPAACVAAIEEGPSRERRSFTQRSVNGEDHRPPVTTYRWGGTSGCTLRSLLRRLLVGGGPSNVVCCPASFTKQGNSSKRRGNVRGPLKIPTFPKDFILFIIIWTALERSGGLSVWIFSGLCGPPQCQESWSHTPLSFA